MYKNASEALKYVKVLIAPVAARAMLYISCCRDAVFFEAQ